MVAFAGAVEGEEAAGSSAKSNGDEGMIAEEEGGEANAAGAESTAESGGGVDDETWEAVNGIAPADDKMLAVGLESPDFVEHGADAQDGAGGEVEDDGLAMFSE